MSKVSISAKALVRCSVWKMIVRQRDFDCNSYFNSHAVGITFQSSKLVVIITQHILRWITKRSLSIGNDTNTSTGELLSKRTYWNLEAVRSAFLHMCRVHCALDTDVTNGWEVIKSFSNGILFSKHEHYTIVTSKSCGVSLQMYNCMYSQGR